MSQLAAFFVVIVTNRPGRLKSPIRLCFTLSHADRFANTSCSLTVAVFAVCSQNVYRPFESELSMSVAVLFAHGSLLRAKSSSDFLGAKIR